MCKISVVTSVYNCEKYIGETIQSVINQTYTDWEFILIDDCSRDRSAEIIKSFNDERIRYILNDSNQGQCANLNRGIMMAKGEFIARLDHDDICYPERFEKQLAYMEENKEVVMAGSHADIWERGIITSLNLPPIVTNQELRLSMLVSDCLTHSTFFIRKSALIDNDIWYGDFKYAEDYDLIVKLLQVGEIGFIRESLVAYRVFPEQYTQTSSRELQENEKREIRQSYIDNLKLSISDRQMLEKMIYQSLSTRGDYNRFEVAFVNLLKDCKIIDYDNNACVVYIYWIMMRMQKPTLMLAKSYLKSKYRYDEKLQIAKVIGYIFTYCHHHFRKKVE